MDMVYVNMIAFVAATVLAFIGTPLVKKLAVRIGAVDKPNHRKVHTRLMPRLGGLAIYLAFVLGVAIVYPFYSFEHFPAVYGLLIGGTIIVIVGAFDDKYELSAKVKLLGQIIAAAVVVILFDLRIDFVNLPFGDVLAWENLEWISIVITMLWIVGVTNAVNLIDGLDGLAAGVSAIATATMMVIAIMMGNIPVVLLSALLLGSTLGFLIFNFHPAKIFMGDTGALFLGFTLSTLSVLGFKSVTLVSFIIPLMILGVPLSDTFFAIIRRIVNKKPISVADKSHLHHCLHLQLGFSHRKTVLIIYGIAAMFGGFAIISAFMISQALTWVIILTILALLIIIQLGAEAIGIISKGKKPLLNLLRRLQLFTTQLFR